MELMDCEFVQIKQEHSYPRVVEQDPHRIFPEESTIKIENEDIVIKQDELEIVDVNESVEYFNFSSIDQQFENHHALSNSSTLLPDEESDHCDNEVDCVELENNCDVSSKIDSSILVNHESVDMVPKQIFLEFQQNYEKTITDLKNRSERLMSVADRLTKENAEIIQGPVDEAFSFDPHPSTVKALTIENERLKEELKDSKVKELALKRRVHMRERSLEATRKAMALLKEQYSSDVNTKKKFLEEINELKQQLNVKEAQAKQQRTALDTAKKDNSKLNDQKVFYKSAFQKANKDLSATAKELADSIRIREMLTERSIRLNKLLEEGTDQHNSSFEEVHRDLKKSLQNVKDLQHSLDVERKKNLYLVKERDQLLEEQLVKYREASVELFQTKQELASSNELLSCKIEESKQLEMELKKLTGELLQKDLNFKKEEECKVKACEYCGFE